MNNLIDLEKKINSELTTKVNFSKISHDQLFITIDNNDLLDVVTFLKTNNDSKFRQLIDITAVDYPENPQRFKMVYMFLSHQFNQRVILSFFRLLVNFTSKMKINKIWSYKHLLVK